MCVVTERNHSMIDFKHVTVSVRPRHQRRVDHPDGSGFHFVPATCREYKEAMETANDALGSESIRLTVENGKLTQKVAELEEKLRFQQELMDRSLPIAFNCGRTVAVMLDVDAAGVTPSLAADGKSVQVEIDGLTLNIFPFTEEVVVHIQDTMESRTFTVKEGNIAPFQDEIIGMHTRSQRVDKAAKLHLSLAGGTAVDGKVA